MRSIYDQEMRDIQRDSIHMCNLASETLQDVMEAGWLVSSVDLGGARLRSGGILSAIARLIKPKIVIGFEHLNSTSRGNRTVSS